MAHLWQILIAVAAVSVIFGVIWSLFWSLKTPVRCGHGTGMSTVLTVQGGAEGLEQTLKGLVWLHENGTMSGQILLVDAGLNDEGRILARLILKKYTGVAFCKAEEVTEWITRVSN